MSTLTIPAELVALVRSALFTELGSAAEETAHVVEQHDHEDHTERFTEPLLRHNAARALLDAIRWQGAEHPADVQVDLHTHHTALTAALDVALLVGDEELAEAERVDAERAQRGEPSKRDTTTRRVLALREFAAAVQAQADQLREGRR